MLDRPPRPGSARSFAASPQLLALVLLGAMACGGDGGKTTVAKTDPAKTETKTTDAKVDGGEANVDGGDAKAEGGDAKAEGGEAKAEGGEAKAEGGEAKAEGGEAKADDGASDTTGGAAPADPAALLTEVKNKKTKDERAIAALEEALTAGAKLRDVAKAANARGEKLYETPDRAKTFFEWAAAKDPKYPDPEFNLAKQLVVTGDLDECKKHLEEVKKRGGKKLLGQIEYDATWEVVKDDPAVRKLIEG
ncbi:MAG TPA: hypothetical protein VG755_11785 [Nannocystaceae bacterium]|nr:hypothetical protein [Nannocystaceae bacterium]